MLARANRLREKAQVTPVMQNTLLKVAAKNMVANLAITLRMWLSTTGDITNIT